MIHVPRTGAAPAHLATHGAQQAQHLCDKRRDYYVTLAAYHRGGRKPPKPRKPHANREHYAHADVRTALEALFGSKCAYCETEVRASGPQHIEHYRPQSIYPVLAYQWDNLLLACAACNTIYKSDRFPVAPSGNTPAERRRDPHARDDTDAALLIDPCRDQPELHLTFRSGYVVALSRRGHLTRRVCGLNRGDLVRNRRKDLEMLHFCLELYREAERIGDRTRQAKYADHLREFCHEHFPYAGMMRAELAQTGIDWRTL